jgi:hypothetical protein
MVGFAKPERHGEHDLVSDALDDCLGQMVRVVERRTSASGGIHIDGFPETERERKKRDGAGIVALVRSI